MGKIANTTKGFAIGPQEYSVILVAPSDLSAFFSGPSTSHQGNELETKNLSCKSAIIIREQTAWLLFPSGPSRHNACLMVSSQFCQSMGFRQLAGLRTVSRRAIGPRNLTDWRHMRMTPFLNGNEEPRITSLIPLDPTLFICTGTSY